MARNVQLSDLRTRAKALTDMDAEAFVSDAQWNIFLNNSLTALYDVLVSKYQDDLLVPSIVAITKDSDGLYSGPLPADFYKVGFVDALLDGTNYKKVRRFMTDEMDDLTGLSGVLVTGLPMLRYQLRGKTKIYVMPAPPVVSSVRVFYVPALAVLAADGDTFDGVNGWDEFVVVDAGIQARIREESDVTALERRRAQLLARIELNAENRDSNEPMRVVDVRGRGWEW